NTTGNQQYILHRSLHHLFSLCFKSPMAANFQIFGKLRLIFIQFGFNGHQCALIGFDGVGQAVPRCGLAIFPGGL
ncbi:MAG: hypothetical protein AB7E95_14510, partial [Kiritimatiellales bacterium]